jgi:hypothetical protein
MKLQVALETLLRRLPGLRLTGDGPAHLPLAWDMSTVD